MTFTRDKLESDSPCGISGTPSSVAFLHPAYADGANKLLALPALDSGGIHYGTALTICGIIAGNSFSTGFFAKSREAQHETPEWDSVLSGSAYYFFASSDKSCQYPIYASFGEWRFPTALPPEWQNYTIPTSSSTRPFIELEAQLQERDRSCRLTSDEDGCEVAHLVPRSESVWFIRNQMADYVNAGDPQAIDHHANALLLRADLHHLMDSRVWVPMLKEGRLVLCSICKPPAQPLSQQFRARYQNTALQVLAGVSKECIFARVAWAVIPLAQQFLQLRWSQPQETTSVFSGEGVARSMNSFELRTKVIIDSQARSRTESPTKRTRSNSVTPAASDSNALMDGYDNAYCSWPSFGDSAYSSDDEEVCSRDSLPRGRKRRRLSLEGNLEGLLGELLSARQ